MKKAIKITSVLLLLFNLIGAFYGGISLIMYPDGNNLQLSLDLLEHTPFKNYLIPGILLLIANGLFCAIVLVKVFRNNRNYGKFILAQGTILTGWIVIQILLIRMIFFLHIILGSVGIILIILGWLQRSSVLLRSEKSNV
jgi:hypothetical protein